MPVSTALLFTLSTGLVADTGGWMWRGELGGQIDPSPHGVVNAFAKNGALELALLTDTLEVTYAPATGSGRRWIRGRAQAFAAQLYIAPWADGAPDPSRSFLGLSASADVGFVEYLHGGFYLGVSLEARAMRFLRRSSSVGPTPPDVLAVSPEVAAGLWTPEAEISVSAGSELRAHRSSPRGRLRLRLEPRGTITPFVLLEAGVARDQDEVSRTRLGGLNPYVVPLAGAGWAEWWVEDFAALRLGPRLSAGAFSVTPVADLVWFDGRSAVGLGLLTGVRFSGVRVDASLGYAPGIPRMAGVSRLSAWVLLGIDWLPML